MNPRIVLHVDDEDHDLFFMKRAWAEAGLKESLVSLSSGQAAIAYLTGTGEYADRIAHPLPGLMLLDLNMPRVSGFDVLAWLRAAPTMATLPVIILTSSSQEADVHRAFQLGANAYLLKPGTPRELVPLVLATKVFWFDFAAPPPECVRAT